MREATVMMEVVESPLLMVAEDGLADRLKSTTFTVTVTEWARLPLVPVTATV